VCVCVCNYIYIVTGIHGNFVDQRFSVYAMTAGGIPGFSIDLRRRNYRATRSSVKQKVLFMRMFVTNTTQ